MSNFTERFRLQVRASGDAVAFANSNGESITYRQLDAASDRIGCRFNELDPTGAPIVLYGHKSPYLVACILACMKSGHAYVPIDTLFPIGRIADIVEQLGGPVVVNTTETDLTEALSGASHVLGLDEVRAIAESDTVVTLDESTSIEGADPIYIMFTSGSTGKPKGVVMRTDAIDAFTEHFIDLFDAHEGDIYFNRVPFSFDMSIFDLTAGLATGGSLFALEAAAESSFASIFEALGSCHACKWTSTPSFLEACLADPSFSPDLMPELITVVVAGEVLRNQTALRFMERFPHATIWNAYGPTEAESVCEMVITHQIAEQCNPLPVGIMSPGMHAIIRDPETLAELPVGAEGEIYLAGVTVAQGYYNNAELTAKAFSEVEIEGKRVRCYKTGDRGFIDEHGWLFCLGRYDFQVKLSGYRVEIGEIEEVLCALDEVRDAYVVPVTRSGAISHLCAFVQLAGDEPDASYAQTKSLKNKIKDVLPDYMVPRAFKYVEAFPVNVNGKIDRKQLGEMAGSR